MTKASFRELVDSDPEILKKIMQVVHERKERDAKRKADEDAKKKADEEAKRLAFAQANNSAAVSIPVPNVPEPATGPPSALLASPGYIDIPRNGDTTFPRRLSTMNRVSRIFGTAGRRSHFFT